MEKVKSNGIQERIRNVLNALNENLYGKEEAVRIALLSSIAGESTFLLGQPGVAKSMICRAVAKAFSDVDKESEVFEYLMNEYSTPDEICGPVSLTQLNEDKYVRLTKGFLPQAKIAFLDEIWKSGPAILNTLLTIINEKKFHNGNKVEKVPLLSLTAASNELPARNQNLEALWDRFIMRVFVNPIEKEEDFFALLDQPSKIEEKQIPEAMKGELLKVSEIGEWQKEIDRVQLGEDAKRIICGIRKQLEVLNLDENHKGDERYYVSDRRWKKIVHMMKTSAFLNGRNCVDLMDCSLMEYALWNTEKQQKEIREIIRKQIEENGMEMEIDFDEVEGKVKDFENTVNETWFNKKEILGKPLIRELGISKYYQVEDKSDKYITLICVDCETNYYGETELRKTYDSKISWPQDHYFEKINIETEKNFVRQDGKEYRILREDSTVEYNLKNLDPSSRKYLEKEFDSQFYVPLENEIEKQIKALEEFKSKNEAQFNGNIFADSFYREAVFVKVDNCVKMLEDEILKIKKQHARFSDSSDFKIENGDYIMKNGEIRSEKECGKDKENAVCVAWTGIGLGTEFFENHDWSEAVNDAEKYGESNGFEGAYKSGWHLPSKKELEVLFKLRKCSSDFSGKYWTGDEENGGAWFFDFDTGKADYTTLDHKFNVCVVRKIG